jgi:hypothetical protein
LSRARLARAAFELAVVLEDLIFEVRTLDAEEANPRAGSEDIALSALAAGEAPERL